MLPVAEAAAHPGGSQHYTVRSLGGEEDIREAIALCLEVRAQRALPLTVETRLLLIGRRSHPRLRGLGTGVWPDLLLQALAYLASCPLQVVVGLQAHPEALTSAEEAGETESSVG